MSVIGEPIGKSVVEVGLDDSKLVSGLTNLNAKMKLADNTWKQSLSTFKQSDRSIEKLSVSVKGMTDKLKVQSQIVEVHKQKVAKLTSEYGETHTKVIKANAELKKQEATFGNLKRSISEVTSEIEQLKKAEQINNSPWGKRSQELQRYSDRLSAVGDKMTSIGQNMSMTVTAPIAAGFGIAVKSSMDFEAQMDRVGAISDTTGSKFNNMTKLAMELGASTTKSASEVAKGMEEMAAKGYNANQIMQAMPGIISAAEASGSDMAQTAEVMASAMNAFGIEAGKSGHVADVLAQTANQSAADITDMQYALKYAAAPAHSLGMSLEETSASIGMMVDAGLKGEQAGTTLRGALLGLLDPSEQNSKTMDKMGIAITDNEGNFVGMSKLIGNLQESMEGMTDTQKAATLSQLVGKEAVSGMLVMMQKSPEQIDKMTNALEQSDGASKKAADAMMDNLKGAVEEMKGAFETLGIQVGQDLTPMIKGLADGLQRAATNFSEMPGWARKTAVGIGLVAAATGPVILGLGIVAKSASTAASGLSRLTGTFAKNTVAAEVNAAANLAAGASIEKQGGKLGKVTGLFTNLSKGATGAAGSVGLLGRAGSIASKGIGLFASGPVGIAIGVVTTLATTFKLAYDHIGWFHDGVENTKKLLGEVASTIDFDWVGNLGNGIKDTGKWLADSTGKLARFGFEISPIGMISKNTFKVVGDSVKKATDTVDVFGKGVGKSTKKVLQEYTDLSMKASKKLEDLKISHKTIGDQQYKEVVSIYSKINDDVTKKLDERHKRETDGLKKLLADTKGISNQEKQRVLAEAQSGNLAEVKAANTINKKIMDIYKKAKTEKRALTRTEENKIANLQKQMDQKVVASLSNSEKEQRIILGRLKSNKKTLSIQAASEVIKASAKERDDSIKNARKKRDKTIDEAIYQRDITKNISKEQADKIIKDAERQYKKSKNSAESQHKDVVKEAERQNKGVRREIDSQTGRVLSNWEKLKKDTKPIVSLITSFSVGKFKEMYKGVTKWIGDSKEYISDTFSKIYKNISKTAEDIREATVDKFESMYDGATKWVSNIGKFITDSKKGITDKASSMGKSVANGAIGGLNGMIDGINKISSGIMDKNLLSKIPTLSTGTVKDGAIAKPTLAVVGDKGPGNGPNGYRQEIIQRANGDMHLTPAKDTLVHLGKGDRVLSGSETYSMLNGSIPHFSKGTDDNFYSKLKKGAHNVKEHAMDGIGAVKKGVSHKVGQAKDVIGDIMDYIENPKALVDKVLDSMGIDFSGLGATGTLAKSAYNKLKTMLQNKIKDWFESSGGDGFNPFSNWKKTPGRGWAAGGHAGIDYAMPAGTPIPSPITGEVLQSWFSPYKPSGGNEVQIFADGFTHILMHMLNGSRKVKKGDRVTAGQIIGKVGNTGNSFGDHLHWQVNKGRGYMRNEDSIDPELWARKYAKGSSGKGTWTSQIKKAASKMGAKVNNQDISDIMSLINKESSGNETVVQHGYVDRNTGGNEARGLLQYTPGTFAGYKVPGYGNILSGYNQLLAFFNNSNWRGDLSAWQRRIASGSTGWGPSGSRKYSTGAYINEAHNAIVGDKGPGNGPNGFTRELIHRSNGDVQLTPNKDTLVNLGKGDRVLNGSQTYSILSDMFPKFSRGTKQKTHRVKWGDTLWDISRKNGTTVKALQLLNGIKNHLIYPGQIIKLTGSITNLSKNVSKQTKVQSKPKVSTSYISRAQSLYNTGKSILNRGKSSNKVTGKDDVNLGTLIMNNTKNLGSLSLEVAQKNIDTIVKKINSMITSSTGKISSLNNKISKSTNKKTIANARNDIQSYKAQIASLKKLKQNEVLKTNYLKNLIKEKSSLTAKLNQRTEEGKALQEEKTNYRSSIASNLQNYAGFGVAKGHTSRDFVSFMKYRLSKMKEYASNVRKLKSMGLDPILLRELLAGGIENSMPRVAALVKGGKGYIGQINTLQKSINAEVNKISNEQANFGYNSDINANNKQIQTLKNQQKKIDKKKVVYLNERKRITKSNAKANPKKPISNTSRTVTTMRTHNIKWGDTLGHIAQRYGTTVNELKKANNLKSDMIYAGRTLKVPTKKVVQLPKTQTALDKSTKYIMDTAKRYQLVNNSSKLNNLQKQLNKIKSDKDKKNDVVITKLEKTLRDLTKKYDKQDDVVKLLQQLVNKNPDILLNGVKLTKEMDKLLANNSKINARRKAR
ncbi:phage tail tape measure protein [Macrococcoides caseolyticum]|uniref:phage tail tape measure protein n=1 Tax=Macrococcoides caseolyticum TaxID=69966 RepID=UPI001C5E3700|nr:phage tail tape measure protein [Macrococcus caseolyticus]QYA34724.1 phage tail tape measure protein [Macrococcus caseolyticus]